MLLSIRSKVLLLSLTFFSIPYMGYEYIRAMESYLRDNLEVSLKEAARTHASALNHRSELFTRNLTDTLEKESVLFTYSLRNAIQLDGKLEDWEDYLPKANLYAEKHILKNQGNYSPDSLSFQHIQGKYKGQLYVLFIVKDEKLVYRTNSSLRLDKSDHLQIVMRQPDHIFSRYIISPLNDGWVNAYKVNNLVGDLSPQIETRIQGVWKTIDKGYLIEIRLPLAMIGEKLGFAIADVDNDNQRAIKTLIGTSAIHNMDKLGTVFIPSPEIDQLMQSMGETAGRRVWVLDRQRRVLSQTGDLGQAMETHPLNWLYSLLLPPIAQHFKDDQAGASHLVGSEVNQALSGQSSTRWRSTSDQQAVIVSAAHPIWVNEEIVGAVVVEETTNSIQTVQRQAMVDLFNRTVLLVSVVTLSLLLFATHLSLRLRKLRNQAEKAIDVNGKIHIASIDSGARDEIGDLARSFSNILEKLKQYNTYLETMASRLSHELRTPIAVVRSSLENLELEKEILPNDSVVYIERAKQGIDRLNTIINRLSEATRIEQALQKGEREPFDLADVISSCVGGYRMVYPHKQFQATLEMNSLIVQGVPDLIVQMLDKLVANAVDFAEENSLIKIQLHRDKTTARLDVINRGAFLPTEMQEQLFESMVSMRPPAIQKKEPHLGLGLYIVRLIAGYHGGTVKARNHETEKGVIVSVWLPLLPLE